MSGIENDAGFMPAFMDFAKVSSRYQRLIHQFFDGSHVHAYLFTGARGIGKETFAFYLSSILFCENETKPCGTCHNCKAIASGNHPNITFVTPTDTKSISIDRIRDIISMASVHSFDSRVRVIILKPIESLTPQAQNCLLKSLEDPTANVVYFLLSNDPSTLIDTIVSRCAVLKMFPWPDEVMQRFLLQSGYPHDTVEQAIVLSGGIIGEALSLLNRNDDADESILRQILTVSDTSQAVHCSTLLKDHSQDAEHILTMLERYIRQYIVAKTNLTVLHSTDDAWSEYQNNIILDDLLDLTEHIYQTRKLRMSNVNWQASIDQLIMKVLEAKRKWQKS